MQNTSELILLGKLDCMIWDVEFMGNFFMNTDIWVGCCEISVRVSRFWGGSWDFGRVRV